MATKFYQCTVCGNVVVKVVDSGVQPWCCGREMLELVPGTVDGSKEKHIPILIEVYACVARVRIGAQSHPMTDEHYIVFVVLETESGIQIQYLDPDSEPEVAFCYDGNDGIKAIYAYCNIHGLWKNEIRFD